VKDSGGPLQGVSVKLKGTSMGTITDPKGWFSINAQSGQTLVFSAIGFESKEVLYTGQTAINMTLTESFSKLNEVVVMGYGTTTKKEVTSALPHLNLPILTKVISAIPVGLLQGKVAGLNIARPGGGDVNGGYDIQLRG